MTGATLCSGIGAPECAAPWIDWLWCAEIEPFPSAVLLERFGHPNLGDMTAPDFVERAAAIGLPDVIVAGTPCQAFSVAGRRASLADARGNLTLAFVVICDAIDDLRRAAGLAPLWIVWENVPGVFTVDDNAFGAFLGGLVGGDAPVDPPRGRGWTRAGVVSGPRRCAAWRSLDAQHFGLAQRRERVFVLARGGSGDWSGADALLPIVEGLRWHPAPSRQAREGVAAGALRCSDGGSDVDHARAGHLTPDLAWALQERDAKGADSDTKDGHLIPVAFDPRQITSTTNRSRPKAGDPCHPLHNSASEPPVIAFSCKDDGQGAAEPAAVRRLTPGECESLQGFRRGHTLVRYRRAPAKDGPRYRALGNSMAVPVLRYLLERVRAQS